MSLTRDWQKKLQESHVLYVLTKFNPRQSYSTLCKKRAWGIPYAWLLRHLAEATWTDGPLAWRESTVWATTARWHHSQGFFFHVAYNSSLNGSRWVIPFYAKYTKVLLGAWEGCNGLNRRPSLLTRNIQRSLRLFCGVFLSLFTIRSPLLGSAIVTVAPLKKFEFDRKKVWQRESLKENPLGDTHFRLEFEFSRRIPHTSSAPLIHFRFPINVFITTWVITRPRNRNYFAEIFRERLRGKFCTETGATTA